MLYFFLLLGLTSIVDKTNSYVLMRVRKGENESDVDTLIHKVVPRDTFEKIAGEIAKKQSNGFKRFEVIKRADDSRQAKEDVESIMLALGREQSSTTTNKPPSSLDAIDKIEKMILELAKSKGGPMMRAKEDYNIKPGVIRFKDKKPSMMLELNSGSIISAIKDFLASKTIKNYAEQMAMKAAVVYRAMKDELESNRGLITYSNKKYKY